jgi:dTDP-4-amino-4,6-dideoxygalactose transaminase
MPIFTDFATNEDWDDAWLSLKILMQPWRWNDKNAILEVKKYILEYLKIKDSKIHLFFTGRFALYHLLKSLNLKEGSEILVPAFTCEAVVLPIIALGIKPVYVDIEKNTYSFDCNTLKSSISKKTHALLIQHTFGLRPLYQDKIIEFAVKNGLVVIEDLAHGFFHYRMPDQIKKVLKKKNINYYLLLSFGRNKSVSSVFGGAIVSFNKKTDQKLEKILQTLPSLSYSMIIKLLFYKPIVFLIKKTYSFIIGKALHFFSNGLNLLIPEITKKEKHGLLDHSFNRQYPPTLAWLLKHQLEKSQIINNRRKEAVNLYLKNLKSDARNQVLNLYFNQPLIRFPILVKNRNRILDFFAKKGIYLGKWYDQPVAPKELPLVRVGYQHGSCPIAEQVCQQIINLPTNITLTQAKKIVELLKNEN